MSHILIAYDTTEGQTREIAQRIADAVASAGHEVELDDIRKLPSGVSIGQFDSVIVGASIHLGRHSKRFSEFVTEHLQDFERIPSAFFSVSLSAAVANEEKQDEAETYVTDFLERSGWHPNTTATFGGGLLYREYWFLKRWIVAMETNKNEQSDVKEAGRSWPWWEPYVSTAFAALTFVALLILCER